MAYVPSERAFKFNVGTKQYAIDIQADGIVYFQNTVYLFWMAPEGWHMHYAEMQPPISVNEATVQEAGGVAAFCRIIVAALNKALERIHGMPDVPPSDKIHEQVMDHLRTHLSVGMRGETPFLTLGE